MNFLHFVPSHSDFLDTPLIRANPNKGKSYTISRSRPGELVWMNKREKNRQHGPAWYGAADELPFDKAPVKKDSKVVFQI